MLAAKQRIRKDREFDSVFKGGRSYYSDSLGLKVKKNNLDYNRFGLIISLKVSKKAVSRNLLRRRVREIIRHQNENLKPGFDCVFIFFPLILDKNFQELETAIILSFKKAGLYND